MEKSLHILQLRLAESYVKRGIKMYLMYEIVINYMKINCSHKMNIEIYDKFILFYL